MEYTSSPKPQLSSRANAFSIAALMSSGKPSKEKEAEENTIKPLGKRWRKRGVKIEKLITEIIKVSRCVEITAVKSCIFTQNSIKKMKDLRKEETQQRGKYIRAEK